MVLGESRKKVQERRKNIESRKHGLEKIKETLEIIRNSPKNSAMENTGHTRSQLRDSVNINILEGQLEQYLVKSHPVLKKQHNEAEGKSDAERITISLIEGLYKPDIEEFKNGLAGLNKLNDAKMAKMFKNEYKEINVD